MNSLIVKMIAGIAGITIAVYFLKPGVYYDNNILTIILAGVVIGLLFYFIKPLLEILTLPIRIITLNLFSFVIIMFLVWITEAFFSTHLEINGIKNIFWTSIIVWGTDILFTKLFKHES